MSLQGIKIRTLVVNQLRDALTKRGFEECIPQIMTATKPLEPTIFPFSTQWDRAHRTSTLYLATSPESYLKQILASGEISKCFCISHAFRNLEGEGKYHRPEFLMAEWYQQDSSWLDMMTSVQAVVSEVWQTVCPQSIDCIATPWPKVSLRQLWQTQEACALESIIDESNLAEFARQKGYNTTGATWEQLFYQIIFNDIEPHYPNEPFFLIDFPSRVSPLAKPQAANPLFAERFELLIHRVELANGNTENTNTTTMASVIDNGLIESLNHLQSHQWAGVGLGLDRLAMVIGEIDTIQEIQWL